ncbi:hypothetical protein BGZ60DRAFT_529167 [Tricladium varicosporioides]|nr:hypothetical protein BGZ60DRAFT_529167 [Hymenoscyphus varicosporioides]
MSRDAFRSSASDLGYRGRGGERWDSERFAMERDRNRFGVEDKERFEERDTRFSRVGPVGRLRERSVDEIYDRERRGPRGYEDDRFERRENYYEEPRYERERPRRDVTFAFEKEREREVYRSPSPPRRGGRPAFLRRQSSLDTFDRKPLARFVEREEYNPPARISREELRPPALTPIPLPRTRALPPPRRYAEREYYDEIKVAEPDYYGDDDYRGYPERVREREIIRRRRRSRSRSKESRTSHSVRESVRSSSRGSSSSSSSFETVKSEFPKRGKTRIPARLVSKRAIIDLGYPFEEEGETIIIMKALGRENIDEVIKLSEDYNKVDLKVEMSGGRSEAGTVIEEHRTEVFTIPAPPPPPPANWPTPPPPAPVEIVEETKIVEHVHRSPSPAHSHTSHHHHHGHHGGAIILDAGPREESTFIERKREVYEQSAPIPVGPLALVAPPERIRVKDERAIRAEIRALEAEKEALKAERRADREMRKADRLRRGGRVSETDLVLYDSDRYETTSGQEVTLVRRERIIEPEGGVRIEKDKKGRMSISVPKYI